jgi:hypothetical protein
MLFKYQIAVITLVQFITLSLLGIANALNSIITTCVAHDECISNAIVSTIFFMLTAAWFAFIWILGYSAQERRSKKLILALICAEGMVALIALFNAKHHTDFLGLSTSIIDFFLAAWVILLALRLGKAGGSRVVAPQRGRGRRSRARR